MKGLNSAIMRKDGSDEVCVCVCVCVDVLAR